jgi:phosphohistidine phosphatase
MFQVFLLRHAKSSWDNLNISDIDRPLNKRGIKNAKKLAIYLRNKPIEIELYILIIL